ncbi:MAG: ferredoxin reductase [Alcanivoracaceae bacterium]|jgi:ferredoxin-NADP reductase|nr:ferredoxin reductase [Alcanivoracaceae bacterium]
MTASQTLKRLVAPLVDPGVYDFWAQKINPTLSWERCLARVVERHVEARDTVSLILKPNGLFTGFLPGQHLNVTVEVNGVRLTRSYSPSDAVSNNGRIRLTIKAIPQGKVSQHLVHHCQIGDVVELGKAYGEMILPKQDHAWLFVAAGSGITPIMSMLKTLTQKPLQQPVSLIYWARTRADLCFSETLHEMNNCDPLLKIHIVLTRETHRLDKELDGHPREALFRNLVPDLERRRVYACGPHGFVQSVENLLAGRAAQFQGESFSPAPLVTTAGAPVNVFLSKSNISIQLPSGVPLLNALEAEGLKPAYGCRMGICNTCSCQKLAGTTTDTRNGNTFNEPGAVRLCINSATSDLTLEL